MRDNATDALRTANPEFLKSDEFKNQLRLLGSFDPEIPKVAEHVGNLRQGLDALGPEKPLREEVKALPEKPEPVKAERKPYTEPNPTKPIERPEVNTRQIREKLLDRWTIGETGLNKWQVRALLSSAISPVIGLAVGAMGGGAEGLEAAGAATGLTYAFGPAIVANILEKPAVREWLTRPPAGELAILQQLPHADAIRIVDGLDRVAKVAAQTGTRVSPLLTGFIERAKEAYQKHLGGEEGYIDTSVLHDAMDNLRRLREQLDAIPRPPLPRSRQYGKYITSDVAMHELAEKWKQEHPNPTDADRAALNDQLQKMVDSRSELQDEVDSALASLTDTLRQMNRVKVANMREIKASGLTPAQARDLSVLQKQREDFVKAGDQVGVAEMDRRIAQIQGISNPVEGPKTQQLKRLRSSQ